MRLIASTFISFLLMCLAPTVVAAPVTVSLEALIAEDAAGEISLDQLIAAKLRDELQGRIDLESNALILQQSLGEQTLTEGCNGSKLRRAELRVTLPAQAELGFDFRSVLQPLSVSLNTRADVQVTGSAVQYFGIGNSSNCTRIASDSFDFSVGGELQLTLQVSLDPRAQVVSAERIAIAPRVGIELSVLRQALRVSVDNTVLKPLLEDRLAQAITESFSAASVGQNTQSMVDALQQRVEDSLGGDELFIEMPALDNDLVAQLRRWTDSAQDFPLSDAYLSSKGAEIVRAALWADQERLEELLGGLLACQLGSVYLEEMARRPLYSLSQGQCMATEALDSPLFSDALCQQQVSVEEQSLADYCVLTTDKLALGDGSAYTDTVDRWRLTPGPRLALTLPRFEDDSLQPYVGSVNYRQVATERGLCSLEMRIYTPSPGTENLRPLLAFHGGSWALRGGGFVGLETLISHFTGRGMVVFAPFYRLAGDRDGPSACRQFVAEDLIDDAQAALAWVIENGEEYGANAGPVAVFGQSAGGFLASSLAISHYEQIDAALLM